MKRYNDVIRYLNSHRFSGNMEVSVYLIIRNFEEYAKKFSLSM